MACLQTPLSSTSGRDVASVHTIDYQRLSDDSQEKQDLLDAGQRSGFFNLEVSEYFKGKGLNLEQSVELLYKLSETYFDLSVQAKEKDARTDQSPSQDKGWKNSPCDETFEFSLDELRQGQIKYPSIFEEQRDFLTKFSNACQDVCLKLLDVMSNGIGASGSAHLSAFHGPNDPSDSGLKLVKEPTLKHLADVQDNTHTDSGTYTLLFHHQWGIDLLSPQGWSLIKPIVNQPLINVADSLQRMSGGKLKSPTHRVTQAGDGASERYYIAYFLRPSYEWKKNNLPKA